MAIQKYFLKTIAENVSLSVMSFIFCMFPIFWM